MGQNAAHLARVLRGRIGQEYEIAVNGSVRIGKISTVAEDRVEFELGDEVETRATAEITLLAAIFKFDRFEWAIEKGTELGVARIVPVVARRTDAHLARAAAQRVDRWRRIAHESSQQSRRTQPPEIADPIKLKGTLTNSPGLKILLAESEQDQTLRSVLEHAEGAEGPSAPHLPTSGRCGMTISLAVGPEGGWTADEIKLFANSGWISASLGPTILRAETAIVAALSVAQAFLS